MTQIVSDYVVCVASHTHRQEYIEELLYLQKFLPYIAQAKGVHIAFELIIPDAPLTTAEQRRRLRLLALVQKGRFERVTFLGDSVVPYIGALRRAVQRGTLVRNRAIPGSGLCFFLQEYNVIREHDARA